MSDTDTPAPMQVGYACGCTRPMTTRLGTPGHCPTHPSAPINKCGVAFESSTCAEYAEVARLRDELDAARHEIARLLRGDFTAAEFQNLCHHRDEHPACTAGHFEAGCVEYQRLLFGEAESDRLRAECAAKDAVIRGLAKVANGLFVTGDFTLASGAKSSWKIECDALTVLDWDGLAQMALTVLRPFGNVVGVPRGGIPFANALRPFATSGHLLIVDDVWTTGGSMRRHRETIMRYCHDVGSPTTSVEEAIGLVAFARNRPEPWVTALFQMPQQPTPKTTEP